MPGGTVRLWWLWQLTASVWELLCNEVSGSMNWVCCRVHKLLKTTCHKLPKTEVCKTQEGIRRCSWNSENHSDHSAFLVSASELGQIFLFKATSMEGHTGHDVTVKYNAEWKSGARAVGYG